VSEAAWTDLPAQIRDAEAFLREHQREIERLLAFPGVEGVVLDFPISRFQDEPVARFHRFPQLLIELAGRLRLSLELSIYETSRDSS
jgi:hypothetical protein